jgi:putative serine protease PepD
MGSTRVRIAAAVCAAAVVGGGAGAAAVALTEGSSPSQPVAAVAPAVDRSNVASADLTVGEIAKRLSPGIVEVDATSSGGGTMPYPYGGGSGAEESAEGTGFVYDTKGDIVTNDHVISGADSVKVTFPSGKSYTATVVGSDPSTDIAVLHVDAPASALTVLSLADSSDVSVGDGVVAIGNPFGLDNSVTSGIVSAIGREISAPNGTPIPGAIQTDAAINHGNSGGPLLDLRGKVIGITSQIQSESGGNEGVGFAIPSNTVRSIADQLIANGSVQHALLGVTISSTPAANGGVKVVQVKAGSGAGSAGIQAGDVITAFDGKKVTSATQLRALIASHKPGDKVSVTIDRSGSSKTLSVTLGSTA